MKAMWMLLVVCVAACNQAGAPIVLGDVDRSDADVEILLADLVNEAQPHLDVPEPAGLDITDLSLPDSVDLVQPEVRDVKITEDTACQPNCEGKECGGDGCGGVCGDCSECFSCENGICIDPLPVSECDELWEQVCDDNAAYKICVEYEVEGCASLIWSVPIACPPQHTCEDGECVCVPVCAGKNCGEDGCGGNCGFCSPGWTCDGGICTCAGVVCGDDCCPAGELWTCNDGECCETACGIKECGWDGCGGSCGECADLFEGICLVGDCSGGVCIQMSLGCDDGNPCTIDECAPDGADCVYSSACDDGDPCTKNLCEPSFGCYYPPVNASDDNPCTTDSCVSVGGEAVFVHEEIICPEKSCQVGTCDTETGFCSYVSEPCYDGDPCTVDACDPEDGQCFHYPYEGCDDGNPCTTDECDPLLGDPELSYCVVEEIDCDDENPCTVDVCNQVTGVCMHPPIYCYSTPCENWECDPVQGECVVEPMDCTDCIDPATGVTLLCPGGVGPQGYVPNDCTVDSCEPNSGCVHTPVTNSLVGCGGCLTTDGELDHSACSDGNLCTDDTCVCTSGIPGDCEEAACESTDKACECPGGCADCFCDPLTGQCGAVPGSCSDCIHPATGEIVLCPDVAPEGFVKDLCTLDVCDMDSGKCEHTPVQCFDNNLCTEDLCNAVAGCTFPAISCDDGLPCTMDTCSPAEGCIHELGCDDGELCTTDSCADEPPWGCVFVQYGQECDDGDPCTQDICDGLGGCSNEGGVCDDNNYCTEDICIPDSGNPEVHSCTNIQWSWFCDDGNPCTVEVCQPSTGICYFSTVSCDDCINPSTGEEIECFGIAPPGFILNLCTEDFAVPEDGDCFCTHTEVVTEDGDLCTTDTCDPAIGVVNEPIACEPGFACEGGVCVCQPVCEGKACGEDDECGGVCDGPCSPGNKICSEGICVCEFETCGAACCAAEYICYEGFCCSPDCDDKDCGSDGCGGSCGVCDGVFACFQGACHCPEGVDRYVDPAGADLTETCSIEAPCATVDWAMQFIQPGDTLWFMPGTYPGPVYPGASCVTIRGAGEGGVFIEPQPENGVGIGVFVKKNVSIRDLHIRNAMAGLLVLSSDGIVVKNVAVTDSAVVDSESRGMSFQQCEGVFLEEILVTDLISTGLSPNGIGSEVRGLEIVLSSNVRGNNIVISDLKGGDSLDEPIGDLGGHGGWAFGINGSSSDLVFENIAVTNIIAGIGSSNDGKAYAVKNSQDPAIVSNAVISDVADGLINTTLAWSIIFNATYNPHPDDHEVQVIDPLFADPSTGTLSPSSPAIDAGDPCVPCDNEPGPNGCRINMGAYGGTEQATPAPGADHCDVCPPSPDCQ